MEKANRHASSRRDRQPSDLCQRQSGYLYQRKCGRDVEHGTSAVYSYDDANRLLGISHSLSVNAQPSTLGLAYTYNAVNNRLTRSETVATTPTVTQTYGYDPIDQVTSVNYGTGHSETFAYDATGNRTSATDSASGTTTYTANALARGETKSGANNQKILKRKKRGSEKTRVKKSAGAGSAVDSGAIEE
ncbi:MAG TPA: hypothetical protein VIT91_20120 [Chthoniobacterales bacterium]